MTQSRQDRDREPALDESRRPYNGPRTTVIAWQAGNKWTSPNVVRITNG